MPVKTKVAATFGWLCVETEYGNNKEGDKGAATFGWLCVETLFCQNLGNEKNAAAFARLCVETERLARCRFGGARQPPSRDCVLKRQIQA